MFKFCQGVFLSTLAFATLPTPQIFAQSISADFSTGTIVDRQSNVYQIGGGIQSGDNIFHSFTQLGLGPQEVANFLSQPGINNILSRVTGGDVSVIEGLIRVSGSDANLFIMNPAGIVFGPNAQLDLMGTFTATTADAIAFRGGWFHAVGANDYQSLLDSPTGFIFSEGQPGGIVNEGDLSAANLNLIGGTVIN
ncbi:MAG: filamentous hemagglutinin N-terminal domain-containing protein, partial [Okeania sp. SIO2D1]|nr:filamentous hemagglutinin N-terminal domain-containing protein [Okeania sp. SIO2D1]